jgi:hypothetical protein
MIAALLRLLHRGATPQRELPDTQMHSSVQGTGGVEEEYREAIEHQLRQMGVSPNFATVETRQLGRGVGGKPLVVGLVRLIRWSQRDAVRVMLGLPLLEAKVRLQFEESWVEELSEFGGIWLQATEPLQQRQPLSELALLVQGLDA